MANLTTRDWHCRNRCSGAPWYQTISRRNVKWNSCSFSILVTIMRLTDCCVCGRAVIIIPNTPVCLRWLKLKGVSWLRYCVMSWKRFPHYWFICAENPVVIGWFASQRASYANLMMFSLLLLNKLLNKRSFCRLFETSWCSCCVKN